MVHIDLLCTLLFLARFHSPALLTKVISKMSYRHFLIKKKLSPSYVLITSWVSCCYLPFAHIRVSDIQGQQHCLRS